MFRLIRELVRPYRGSLLIILLSMLAGTLMSLAGPWPLKIIIDNVVGTHKMAPWMAHLLRPILEHGTKMHLALIAALASVFIAAMSALSSYIANYYTESVGQYVAHDLRLRTYQHLQRLSLKYYNDHQVGNLLSTITSDIQTIQGFASSSTLGIVIDLLTIVAMLVLMFWMNLDFTLIALAVTPFLLIFVARFKKAVKKATKEVRKEQSEILATVQQGLESIQVIKAFGREDSKQTELQNVSQATVDAALKARKIKALLSPVVNVTVALITAIVLWRGAALTLSGVMSVGALTVYLSYLAMFFKPLKDLASITNSVAQAAVGVERVRAILDADTIIPEKADAVEPPPLKGDIVFEHVAFGYSVDAQVLGDITFHIQPGQMIGVVGPTGSGKSTIFGLIPRFYDPSAGRVLIDGRDVRDYKLHALREQIGYVLQDTVLFHGTVLENIAFGRPHATRAEIVEAAKMANADEFISKMPNGYDTMVGERGSTLSGGQRQRIGIARVMIRNSPILMLDEPTAALDTESERLVVDALERLMKGRTVIMIAHRLSTIRHTDMILVVSGGIIAESGNHDQLMARNEIYAGLYRTQFGPASAAAPGAS